VDSEEGRNKDLCMRTQRAVAIKREAKGAAVTIREYSGIRGEALAN